MVTPTPKAIDSPAEPAVCTMLFSRIVVRRRPKMREKTRNSVMDRTATGIDADTVMPTFSTRYSDEAPKTRPSREPAMTARQVNSCIRVTSAGTYGLWASPCGVAAAPGTPATTPPAGGGPEGVSERPVGSAIAASPGWVGSRRGNAGRLASGGAKCKTPGACSL